MAAEEVGPVVGRMREWLSGDVLGWLDNILNGPVTVDNAQAVIMQCGFALCDHAQDPFVHQVARHMLEVILNNGLHRLLDVFLPLPKMNDDDDSVTTAFVVACGHGDAFAAAFLDLPSLDVNMMSPKCLPVLYWALGNLSIRDETCFAILERSSGDVLNGLHPGVVDGQESACSSYPLLIAAFSTMWDGPTSRLDWLLDRSEDGFILLDEKTVDVVSSVIREADRRYTIVHKTVNEKIAYAAARAAEYSRKFDALCPQVILQHLSIPALVTLVEDYVLRRKLPRVPPAIEFLDAEASCDTTFFQNLLPSRA